MLHLTKKQANAIMYAMRNMDYNHIVKSHAIKQYEDEQWESEHLIALNDLTVLEVATAIIEGFNVIDGNSKDIREMINK